MIRVVLLGAGNVATHLMKAFSITKKVELVQLYARSKDKIEAFENDVDITTSLSNLKEADVYIIAIADDAIGEFSSQIPLQNALVVHTSGSVSMSSIDSRFRKGVFYPLQTFTKGTTVDFSTIPICIETQHNDDLLVLDKLASAITDAVYFIDSSQRESLHIAAVFVNNFSNHLYHIGKSICSKDNVPFAVLQPLIQETATKIQTIHPFDAQTGPAKRNDVNTISKHLKALPKHYQEIYALLTKSITKTYEQEL